MDYTVANNARLFDALLEVLNKHQKEPGVIEALEDLKAAKTNYVQRSIDHTMNCLVLTVHDLVVHPPSKELWGDLRSVIHQFYQGILQTGPRLTELARQYEVGGGTPLGRNEILQEVDERRGKSQ